MDFTSKNPIALSQYIRWWLGGMSESEISTDNIVKIIEIEDANDSSLTGCDLLYKSTVSVLRYLIREKAKGQAASGGGGAGTYVASQEEKVGDVSTKTSWGISGSADTGVASGFDQTLENLLADPNSIGCPVSQDEITITNGTGVPYFGGVSNAEYDRVRNNPDSRGAFSSYSAPYRQNLSGRKLY